MSFRKHRAPFICINQFCLWSQRAQKGRREGGVHHLPCHCLVSKQDASLGMGLESKHSWTPVPFVPPQTVWKQWDWQRARGREGTKEGQCCYYFCYFCLNCLKNPYDGPVSGMCILQVATAQSSSHLTHRKFRHYTQLRPWQSKLFLNRFHSMPHTHHCWRGTWRLDEVNYVNIYSW